MAATGQVTKKKQKLSLDEAAERALVVYEKHLARLPKEKREAKLKHFLESATHETRAK